MTMNRQRLANVCERLGSSHDGERAAAAYIATKMLRESGLTWSEVVQRAFASNGKSVKRQRVPDKPRKKKDQRPPDNYGEDRRHGVHHAEILKYLAERDFMLTDWENEFVENLMTGWLDLCLSEKQWAVLERLADKTNFQGGNR